MSLRTRQEQISDRSTDSRLQRRGRRRMLERSSECAIPAEFKNRIRVQVTPTSELSRRWQASKLSCILRLYGLELPCYFFFVFAYLGHRPSPPRHIAHPRKSTKGSGSRSPTSTFCLGTIWWLPPRVCAQGQRGCFGFLLRRGSPLALESRAALSAPRTLDPRFGGV